MAKRGTGRRLYDYIPGIQSLSNMAYNTYFTKLLDLMVNRFKYYNVPDSLDIRFMEMSLITTGEAIIFEDEILGLCAFNVSYEGYPDQYGYPIDRQAIAGNGVNFGGLNPGNSVIIYNNRLRLPDIQTVIEYARRMAEIQKIADCNTRQQKATGLILTDDAQRLTMLNALSKWDGNEPILFVGTGFNKDAFSSMGFNIDFKADDLFAYKHKIFNEFLTFMGIANSNTDKKERMVVDEANSSYGSIELARKSYLNEREKAIDNVNKMFNTNIRVEFDSDIPIFNGGKDE